MKYTVTVNGKDYEVEVERANGVYKTVRRAVEARHVTAAPAPGPNTPPTTAHPVHDGTSAVSTAPSAVEGSVVSPMPGNIWDVRCQIGDIVEKDQILFVLEAMKMEIEVPSPAAGTVDRIVVQKGDAVDGGAVLAVLK